MEVVNWMYRGKDTGEINILQDEVPAITKTIVDNVNDNNNNSNNNDNNSNNNNIVVIITIAAARKGGQQSRKQCLHQSIHGHLGQ